MRDLPAPMKALLAQGGPFIGAAASGGFVTVQPDWTLSEVTTGIATTDPTKLPFRWWQRLDNSQTEVVIPGIKSIQWNRTTDQDVATATIVIYNQTHDPALGAQRTPGQLGNPGYLSWGHGQPQANVRWNQQTNVWSNIIVPNALLRTYEGFPGDMTAAAALAGGYVTISGTWLIDDVQVNSNGMLQVTCRDVGKLLIDQQTYLPLMPGSGFGAVGSWYPLSYYRFIFTDVSTPAITQYSHSHPVASGPGAEGIKYVPTIVMSSDAKGYWLLGSDGAVFSFGVPFYGSRGDNQGPVLTMVAMAPTSSGAGYWTCSPDGGVFAYGDATFYGSANGQLSGPQHIVSMAATPDGAGYWLVADDGSVFAYGSAGYFGGTPTGATPFVDIMPSSTGAGYWLLDDMGAIYAYGDATYYGGETTPMVGLGRDSTGGGYWMCAPDGGVFTHGDAAFYGSAAGGLLAGQHIVNMAVAPDGLGYWLVANDGAVFAYGSAAYHGGTPAGAQPIVDIKPTTTGLGYWLVSHVGAVYAYGDAVTHGDPGPPPSHVDTAPMIAMAADPLGRGYWTGSADGGVFAFGDVGFYGSATGALTDPQVIVAMAAHPDGRGYWLVANDGAVFAYGSATYLGGTPAGATAVVDIERSPTGLGYWLLDNVGHVYAYGDAGYFGGGPYASLGPLISKTFVGMAARPSGQGYWLATADGFVYGYGTAINLSPNGTWNSTHPVLVDPIFGIAATPDGGGYVLVGGDGGVFTFGDAPFKGSLPAGFTYEQVTDGNMRDFTDIIRDLLRWSGFLAFGDGKDDVYGYVEQSGTYPDQQMLATVFDKIPVIDAINQIRDALGWLFFIYEDGSVFWGPRNWFTAGNLQFNGGRIQQIPVIDELLLLTEYQVNYKDDNLRSEVIVASSDPDFDLTDTITTRQKISSPLLRGMIRPAMYVNGAISTKAEQQYMVQQIVDHIEFSLREGQSTMWADPSIQINDQVQIYERQTAETYLHLVTGIQSSHDFDTGQWTYTVTSSWFPPDWFTTVREVGQEYIPVANPEPTPLPPPSTGGVEPGGTGGTGGVGGIGGIGGTGGTSGGVLGPYTFDSAGTGGSVLYGPDTFPGTAGQPLGGGWDVVFEGPGTATYNAGGGVLLTAVGGGYFGRVRISRPTDYDDAIVSTTFTTEAILHAIALNVVMRFDGTTQNGYYFGADGLGSLGITKQTDAGFLEAPGLAGTPFSFAPSTTYYVVVRAQGTSLDFYVGTTPFAGDYTLHASDGDLASGKVGVMINVGLATTPAVTVLNNFQVQDLTGGVGPAPLPSPWTQVTNNGTVSIVDDAMDLHVDADGVSDGYARAEVAVAWHNFRIEGVVWFSDAAMEGTSVWGRHTGSYEGGPGAPGGNSNGLSFNVIPRLGHISFGKRNWDGTVSTWTEREIGSFTVVAGVHYHFSFQQIEEHSKMWLGTGAWDGTSWLLEADDTTVTGTGDFNFWNGDHGEGPVGPSDVFFDNVLFTNLDAVVPTPIPGGGVPITGVVKLGSVMGNDPVSGPISFGNLIGADAPCGGTFQDLTDDPTPQLIAAYTPWLLERADRLLCITMEPITGFADDATHIANAAATAAACQAAGIAKQVVLRPMQECNGGWFPWGSSQAGNESGALYRSLFRGIAFAARAAAPDIRIAWNTQPGPHGTGITGQAGNNGLTADPELFYPGDDACDIVTLSGYLWAFSTSDHAAEMVQRWTWARDFAAAHGKQWAADEWACVATTSANAGDGNDPTSLIATLNFFRDNGCVYSWYFDLPDGNVDTTLEALPDCIRAFHDFAQTLLTA